MKMMTKQSVVVEDNKKAFETYVSNAFFYCLLRRRISHTTRILCYMRTAASSSKYIRTCVRWPADPFVTSRITIFLDQHRCMFLTIFHPTFHELCIPSRTSKRSLCCGSMIAKRRSPRAVSRFKSPIP